jgi:hypothetical protein
VPEDYHLHRLSLCFPPKRDDRQITEKVNELAVTKVLLDDETITGPITYLRV